MAMVTEFVVITVWKWWLSLLLWWLGMVVTDFVETVCGGGDW